MSAVAQSQAELIMTITSGPDVGAVYQIVSTKITLGRASDNSIVIKDPRCSRYHACIELTPDGVTIADISTQNSIEVDGVVTKHAHLKPGSKVVLGDTSLEFEIRQKQLKMPTATPTAEKPKFSLENTHSHTPMSFGHSNEDTKKRNFYLVVGVVILGFGFIFLGSKAVKNKVIPLRNDEMIEEEIKASQERKTSIARQQMERGVGTSEYNDIQAVYLQGFRDYREGNYARALTAFDSVLALNPKHELAFKYRELAKRRHDELIQLTMLQGKRYMEQNKYALAKNAYMQVLILINDPRNKLYLEAREYYNECVLLMKGAY